MGFLRRLTGSGQSQSTPETARGKFRADIFAGDEVGAAWLERVARGEWTPFARFLAELTDIDRRDFYIHWFASAFKGRPKWVEVWADAEPSSGLALLVRGAQAANWLERGEARPAPTAHPKSSSTSSMSVSSWPVST
jgi:hypothetical protein